MCDLLTVLKNKRKKNCKSNKKNVRQLRRSYKIQQKLH